jgi:hypothetical protein
MAGSTTLRLFWVVTSVWQSVLLFIAQFYFKKQLDGNASARRNFRRYIDRLRQTVLQKNPTTAAVYLRQQDGKTLLSLKKGYIHMRAHVHAHGASNSEKSVLRLADALHSSGASS